MSATAAAIALWSGAAEAREDRRAQIDIAASSLPQAIAELSRESGESIGTDGALPAIRTRPVHGRISVGEALSRLLAGSGYRARRVGERAWRIERIAARPGPAEAAADSTSNAPTARDVIPAEPIIVSGAKRNQPLADLPMAVSVVSLTDRQRHDVSSDTQTVAASMEGLALTSLGPGRNRMFLRGIADSAFSGESQSTVAVVLGEARLTYSAPDPDIRLVDMDRVEVLKGPQGSLYGIGALGGIYHLVPKQAELDETSLAVSTGAEAVASGGTGLSATVVGNLPLVRGTAGLRLVGYSAREPGWIDTGSRTNANSGRVAGARAGLGVEPGGGWRLDLTGFAQWLESKDSRYVYAPGLRSRPDQVAEPHDNDLRHVAARAIGRIGDGIDVTMSSGMTWHEVVDTLDATIGADEFGLPDPRSLEDNRDYRVWDSELRLSGKWRGADWLLGVSHLHATQAEIWTLASLSVAEFVIDDDRRTANDTAAFADVTLPLSRTLKINAGARLFHSVLAERRMASSGEVARERRRNGVTPSLAISWSPDESRLLFVRYGSAFRQGGSDISAAGELETLKGDELAMVEAGWRQTLANGSKLELGTWHAWWENIQSDLLEPDGLIETANVGDGRIVGAEASLEVAIAQRWRVEGGANLTIARLTDSDLGFRVDDRHLPVVPEYTLRGALRHNFTIGETGAAWLRAGVRYIGPAHLSFDPAFDRPMGKVLETQLEGHARFGRLDLALSADNLLNRKADTFAYGNSLRFSQMDQFTPQEPFRVSFSILRTF